MDQLTETQDLFELQMDPFSQNQLADGAKWAKFLSIVGFISCGMIVVFAFSFGYILSLLPNYNSNVEGMAYMRGAITVVYVAIAVIYFFPCLFLFNYSNKIKAALQASDQEILGSAFSNLKSLFKYIGILAIIGISFFLLCIIMMVVGLSAAGGFH